MTITWNKKKNRIDKLNFYDTIEIRSLCGMSRSKLLIKKFLSNSSFSDMKRNNLNALKKSPDLRDTI